MKRKKYIMTVKQLQRLCRDFSVDTFDGFNSNDHAYIEHWLEKNQIKTKKIRWVEPPPPPENRVIKEGETPPPPPSPKARRIYEPCGTSGTSGIDGSSGT